MIQLSLSNEEQGYGIDDARIPSTTTIAPTPSYVFRLPAILAHQVATHVDAVSVVNVSG
jgi:hypothetical protein